MTERNDNEVWEIVCSPQEFGETRNLLEGAVLLGTFS